MGSMENSLHKKVDALYDSASDPIYFYSHLVLCRADAQILSLLQISYYLNGENCASDIIYQTQNYNVTTGGLLMLEDVTVVDHALRSRLGTLLKETYGGQLFPDWQGRLNNYSSKDLKWSISADGITFYFENGSIGNGSPEGMYVTLPVDDGWAIQPQQGDWVRTLPVCNPAAGYSLNEHLYYNGGSRRKTLSIRSVSDPEADLVSVSEIIQYGQSEYLLDIGEHGSVLPVLFHSNFGDLLYLEVTGLLNRQHEIYIFKLSEGTIQPCGVLKAGFTTDEADAPVCIPFSPNHFILFERSFLRGLNEKILPERYLELSNDYSLGTDGLPKAKNDLKRVCVLPGNDVVNTLEDVECQQVSEDGILLGQTHMIPADTPVTLFQTDGKTFVDTRGPGGSFYRFPTSIGYGNDRSVKVKTGYLALRSEPVYDPKNEIGQLQNGDYVLIMSQENETYSRVYVPSLYRYGYVDHNYLE